MSKNNSSSSSFLLTTCSTTGRCRTGKMRSMTAMAVCLVVFVLLQTSLLQPWRIKRFFDAGDIKVVKVGRNETNTRTPTTTAVISTSSAPISIPITTASSYSYHCWGNGLRLFTIEEVEQQQQPGGGNGGNGGNGGSSSTNSKRRKGGRTHSPRPLINVTQNVFLENNYGNRMHSDMFAKWITDYLRKNLPPPPPPPPPLNDDDNNEENNNNTHNDKDKGDLFPVRYNNNSTNSTSTRKRKYEILVIVSDDNLYEAQQQNNSSLLVVSSSNSNKIGGLHPSSSSSPFLPSSLCILSVGGGFEFPNSQLIITPYELKLRIIVKDKIPFQNRSSNHIIWRGDANADPYHARYQIVQLSNSNSNNATTTGNQSSSSSTLSWLNAQYSHYSTQNNGNGINFRLEPQQMCNQYKYHLDIGGYSGTTWNALRWKMDCGSLVFRILSPTGSEDWWHQYLIPFQHYIPIDVTNIKESLIKWYNWAETYPIEAERIAKAGQSISLYTSTNDIMKQQMITSFYNSCIPNLQIYQEYKEFCNQQFKNTTK